MEFSQVVLAPYGLHIHRCDVVGSLKSITWESGMKVACLTIKCNGESFLVKRFWIVCFFAFLIGRKAEEEVFSEIASFVEESIRGKLIFSATIPTPSEVHRSTKHIDKNAIAILKYWRQKWHNYKMADIAEIFWEYLDLYSNCFSILWKLLAEFQQWLGNYPNQVHILLCYQNSEIACKFSASEILSIKEVWLCACWSWTLTWLIELRIVNNSLGLNSQKLSDYDWVNWQKNALLWTNYWILIIAIV